MKKLYELADICKNELDLLQILVKRESDPVLCDMLNMLYSGQGLNNHEAMVQLLGRRDLKLFSSSKTKLSELFIKVISIQNISGSKENIRYNRVLENMRMNLTARIVLYKGARALAIDLLEEAFSNSLMDHLSYSVLDQLRLLTIHYGTSNYNKYKLRKCIEWEKQYSEILSNESKAIRYFVDLKKLEMHSFADIGPMHKAVARQYAEELEKIQLSSRTFNYYRFQVLVKKLEFDRNFRGLLVLCDNAELEFSSVALYSVSSLAAIKQIRLWTLIQLGQYRDCIKQGIPEMANSNLGVVNWYSFVHYTIKAYLYDGNYERAFDLISYCIKHSNYKKLNVEHKEVADLHLGYIHLIIESKIDSSLGALKGKIPSFKIGKFLNTTRVFSKDKRGINVSILLMHIAFLLQRKDYNAIIDRTDSLNQYAYRYLRKDDSFRSNCMIKMVIQMTKADFNPIRTARYTADLRKQLSNVSLAGSGENIEVEIIPFEVLWEIMTKAL